MIHHMKSPSSTGSMRGEQLQYVKLDEGAAGMPRSSASSGISETALGKTAPIMQKPVRVNGVVLASEPHGKPGRTLSGAVSVSDTSSAKPITTSMLGNPPRRATKKGTVFVPGTSSAKPITTFMLGNLPYRATKKDLIEAVNAMGFRGAYHINHFPNANKNKPRSTNLGYAFICFANEEVAASFVESFSNFSIPGRASEKRCTLKLARLQR